MEEGEDEEKDAALLLNSIMKGLQQRHGFPAAAVSTELVMATQEMVSVAVVVSFKRADSVKSVSMGASTACSSAVLW